MYLQYFWFRHVFLLGTAGTAALVTAVVERLSDAKLEVRDLAAATLSGTSRAEREGALGWEEEGGGGETDARRGTGEAPVWPRPRSVSGPGVVATAQLFVRIRSRSSTPRSSSRPP